MTLSRTLTIVVGLAAAGAAGAGVASWMQQRNATGPAVGEGEGFSADEIASIEGIVGAYVNANPVPMSTPEAGFSAAQVASIEETVRNFLLTRPEIMREVFQALEDKEQLAKEEQLKAFIAESADELYGGTEGLILGNPDGDVTLVEFFDYNCAYCKRALSDMTALIQTDSNLRIVMKEFPILSPGSMEAAKVSLAVARQGKGRYQEFHTQLLGSPGTANATKALRLADELGLDMVQLKADLESPEIDAEIKKTMSMAQTIGIQGTPAYVIGTDLIPGAVGLENLRAKIKEVRDRTCVSC
jgi:protein-disulfide isomerase